MPSHVTPRSNKDSTSSSSSPSFASLSIFSSESETERKAQEVDDDEDRGFKGSTATNSLAASFSSRRLHSSAGKAASSA